MTTTSSTVRPSSQKTASASAVASARLPPVLAAAVRRELAADEAVLWIGQPSPSLLARRHFLNSAFGVLWTAFFIGYMVWLRDSGPPVLLISPFVFIGVNMVCSPWLTSTAAKNSVYLVTDRRALVLSRGELGGYPWPAFRLTVKSYDQSELHELQRVKRSPGCCDLVFRVRVDEDYDTTTTTNEGFVGLTDVSAATAEAALRGLRAGLR